MFKSGMFLAFAVEVVHFSKCSRICNLTRHSLARLTIFDVLLTFLDNSGPFSSCGCWSVGF